MRILLSVIFCTISIFSAAQDIPSGNRDKKWDVGLEGMIAVSFGNELIAFNAGGPAFQFVINEFKIGVGAFPSFYILDGRIGARLGVSPRIDYKNLVFMTPLYYRESQNDWLLSVGMGYKFLKKDKDK